MKYGPRSRTNARKLIQAATDLGFDTRVVKTTVGGYDAPQEVVLRVMGIDPDEPTVVEKEPTEVAEKPAGNRSRDAWETYATSIGVQVDHAMTRNDIRDAVQAHEEGKNSGH